MSGPKRMAAFTQNPTELLGYYDTSMTATCASKGDRQVSLPFLNIRGNQEFEKWECVFQKGSGKRLFKNVGADILLKACSLPQLGDPMRIGQETTVDNQIGFGGYPVLVTERHNGCLHELFIVYIAEHLDDPGFQFMDDEITCIDD